MLKTLFGIAVRRFYRRAGPPLEADAPRAVPDRGDRVFGSPRAYIRREIARRSPRTGRRGRYNLAVAPVPLTLDTSPDVERLQVERWRRMSPAQKAALVSGLTQAVWELALAGVRSRYPDASPREHFLRLAMITLGPDLARRVYPEIAALDRS